MGSGLWGTVEDMDVCTQHLLVDAVVAGEGDQGQLKKSEERKKIVGNI